MVHNFGLVWFAGMKCSERRSQGNRGAIAIGGNLGDVRAASATNEQQAGTDGVLLADVSLFSTLAVTDDRAGEIVREVVELAYESVQSDIFVQV